MTGLRYGAGRAINLLLVASCFSGFATISQVSAEDCIPPDGQYISHFTGFNCTGTESYYRPYDSWQYLCRPDNSESAVCGSELRTETNVSYSYQGACYNAWPAGNTLSNFVRVYRQGVQPDGEYISHFTGLNCTGTESYYTPYAYYAYECRPDNSSGAVCGEERRTETNLSYSYLGRCRNEWMPEGNTLGDFVTVYRGCGVDGTEECGNGECNAGETTETCSQDCNDCVLPDGEYISHFSELGCTGTEGYYTLYAGGRFACRPDDSEGALCGTVHYTATHKSYSYKGVCYDEWPEGNTLTDFVRVYRNGCEPEPDPYCGDGTCNGDESCLTCPSDCGECGPVCGDNVCEPPETLLSCPKDCRVPANPVNN